MYLDIKLRETLKGGKCNTTTMEMGP